MQLFGSASGDIWTEYQTKVTEVTDVLSVPRKKKGKVINHEQQIKTGLQRGAFLSLFGGELYPERGGGSGGVYEPRKNRTKAACQRRDSGTH